MCSRNACIWRRLPGRAGGGRAQRVDGRSWERRTLPGVVQRADRGHPAALDARHGASARKAQVVDIQDVCPAVLHAVHRLFQHGRAQQAFLRRGGPRVGLPRRVEDKPGEGRLRRQPDGRRRKGAQAQAVRRNHRPPRRSVDRGRWGMAPVALVQARNVSRRRVEAGVLLVVRRTCRGVGGVGGTHRRNRRRPRVRHVHPRRRVELRRVEARQSRDDKDMVPRRRPVGRVFLCQVSRLQAPPRAYAQPRAQLCRLGRAVLPRDALRGVPALGLRPHAGREDSRGECADGHREQGDDGVCHAAAGASDAKLRPRRAESRLRRLRAAVGRDPPMARGRSSTCPT